MLLCGALATVAAATPIFAQVDGVKVVFNAQVRPKTLPRSRRAPASIHLTGQLASTAGTHVPAANRATIDIDRDIVVDTRGVPACTAGQLEGKTAEGAEASCPGAIVGGGWVAAEVAFPGQPPIRIRSRLIAVNGGSEGGTTTLLLHAYLDAPAGQAFDASVTLTKLAKGSFGLRAHVTVPQIAAGAGSLTAIDLSLRGRVPGGDGRSRGYLKAKCPDGNLLVEPVVEFVSGDTLRGLMAIGCNPTGRG